METIKDLEYTNGFTQLRQNHKQGPVADYKRIVDCEAPGKALFIEDLKKTMVDDIKFLRSRIAEGKKTNNSDWVIPAEGKIEYIMEKFNLTEEEIAKW